MKDIINDKNASLVDVRTPMEFTGGNVKGTINIPMDEVPERLEELKKLSKPLVLFCQSGNRSGQVMNFLKHQGFEDVHNGGGWMEVNGMLNH